MPLAQWIYWFQSKTNIPFSRHPDHTPIPVMWAHHEKLVIIDQVCISILLFCIVFLYYVYTPQNVQQRQFVAFN